MEKNYSSDLKSNEKFIIRNPYSRKRPRSSSSGKNSEKICGPAEQIRQETTNRVQFTDVVKDGSNNTNNNTVLQESASALVISAADKAGMDGIDRTVIDAIILKESGNSLFMQQQRRRDEKVNERIIHLKQKLQTIKTVSKDWRISLQRQIDYEIPSWLSTRNNRSVKVVVDMDMFYMACELLNRPDITDDTPACVGGPAMISTSNYAARRYGVRSAMPGFVGEALVNQLSNGKKKLIYCKLNFDLYKEKSQVVRTALSEFDPNLSAYSLDEVYLDISRYLTCQLIHPNWTHDEIAKAISAEEPHHANDVEKDQLEDNEDDEQQDVSATETTKIPMHEAYATKEQSLEFLQSVPSKICISKAEVILHDMRDRVKKATGGLTCSAGLAPNFLLAKIASDRNKPNGQLLIPSDHDSVLNFLHPLPIRKVSGIGRVTEKILKAFGIDTVKHLYQERALVSFLFGPNSSSAAFLLRASVGCSSSDGKVSDEDESSSSQQKGISRERTFSSTNNMSEVYTKLEDIGRLLAEDMKRKNLHAQTISVKVKLHTFDCLSRARTMSKGVYVQSSDDIVSIASQLLSEIRDKHEDNEKNGDNKKRQQFSVRLLGVRCTNFIDTDAANKDDGQTTLDSFVKAKTEANCHSPSPKDCVAATDTTNPALTKNPYSPKGKLAVERIQSPSPKDHNAATDTEQHDTKLSLPKNPYSPKGKLAAERLQSPTRTAVDPVVEQKIPHSIQVQCPICSRNFEGDTIELANEEVNRHVDICLNGTAVRQAVRETRNNEFSPKQRKKKLSETFFHCRKAQVCKKTK